VFQIESRAQMAMLPRLRPRCFYDLVIEVAIVRPGPIQGDMVHPYLRRRAGELSIDFPDDRVREVLVKTLGVPIFQEQAMRLAIVAAGFTPGEADQLRRAMGAWRRQGVIDQFNEKLVNGLMANGYSAEFAERLFKQIRGFGEYGFPESHAASFALLVYASAWIKCYYPAVFAAALLNSQPMGFYAPAQLVANARQHDVQVLPVDVNYSDWDCTLEPLGATTLALRLGFRMVQGLSKAHIERLIEERGRRLFDSWEDFACRTGFSRALLTRLSRADAFQSLAANRRESLWQSLAETDASPLFADVEVPDEKVSLPVMPVAEEVIADYRAMGLSLRPHPVSFLRAELERLKITPADRLAQIANGKVVTVAGIVLMRQRPSTASGVTFVTLEDETGIANLIVHQRVWEQHYQVARSATLLQAQGRLQCQGEVVHVIVSKMKDLSSHLRNLPVESRDFR
jgi:error-prone DNA polymerase